MAPKLFFFLFLIRLVTGGYLTSSGYPSECDKVKALKCEYDFLLCKLFNGPANDKVTLCNCAKIFYGECLRLAGCETANEVGPLTLHEIYMKTCVDFIIENNCPDPLICSINCASDTTVDTSQMKIIPFNNYGEYYLRVRTCQYKVHNQQLSRYSMVNQVSCSKLADYQVCSRWIPPMTFVPVALPIDITYIEIDSCEIGFNNTRICRTTDPAPTRIYGNKYQFPKSYDVAQTNISVCSTNDDCLGSFCDVKYHPPICSPKTIEQALGAGKDYLTLKN